MKMRKQISILFALALCLTVAPIASANAPEENTDSDLSFGVQLGDTLRVGTYLRHRHS
ncbi:MAG: hypothetical protein IJH94_02215 [Clostridia bacterium]|nr:hypothetical protein [Clostridia bacterium]